MYYSIAATSKEQLCPVASANFSLSHPPFLTDFPGESYLTIK